VVVTITGFGASCRRAGACPAVRHTGYIGHSCPALGRVLPETSVAAGQRDSKLILTIDLYRGFQYIGGVAVKRHERAGRQ
jgi:hypothetical protein